MPYEKYFISEEPFPDTVVLPLPPDFPDPRVLTEYFEAPGALIVFEKPPESERDKARVETMLQRRARDFLAHTGQIGCVRSDGTLVWGKIVPSRIGIEGLLDWLANSRHKAPYPDRPPDVDTALLRSWIQHPVEVGAGGAMLSKTMPTISSVTDNHPVCTFTVKRIDGLVMKVLVDWRRYVERDDELPAALAYLVGAENGVYRLRLKVQDADTGNVPTDFMFAFDDADDTVGEKLDDLLALVANLADPTDVPLVATYEDFREVIEAGDAAVQEMKDYYAAEMLRRPTAGGPVA